jgi:hypothetical protein
LRRLPYCAACRVSSWSGRYSGWNQRSAIKVGLIAAGHRAALDQSERAKSRQIGFRARIGFSPDCQRVLKRHA